MSLSEISAYVYKHYTYSIHLFLTSIIISEIIPFGIMTMKITAIQTFMANFGNRPRELIKVERMKVSMGGVNPILRNHIFPNFKILEYLLPTDNTWNSWVDEPYMPKDEYLELRDRPRFGVEIDENAVTDNEYVHWQRTYPIRPDGSIGYL